jgi:alkylation response protein AidB-like acyl-CoA dehydrogenase
MKEHAFGLTLKRAGDEGGKASAVASMFKYYGTEHNKKRHEMMVAAMGSHGVGWDGDEFDKEEKNLTKAWLRTKGNSIEGGTSEVQLNVISKRVLGLPS